MSDSTSDPTLRGPVTVVASDILATFPDITATEPELDIHIGRATRLLYQLVPGLNARLDAGDITEALVADKITEAVARIVRAPDPRFQVEAELGYRYQLNQRAASGTLWYPDEDLALLRGVSPLSAAYGTVFISPGRTWSDSAIRGTHGYGEVPNADQRRG